MIFSDREKMFNFSSRIKIKELGTKYWKSVNKVVLITYRFFLETGIYRKHE